jgi:hypothetical protein
MTTKLKAIASYLENKPSYTYVVSVMGTGLTHIHTERVSASTPGDAIDMVIGKLGHDKNLSQYACILDDAPPIKLEVV